MSNTFTLTQGLDTYIAGYTPWVGWNYGISGGLGAGSSGSANMPYRGMIMFPQLLNYLPADATNIVATLRLYCASEETTTNYNVAVRKALTQWFEGNQAGAAPPAGVDGSTWQYRNKNGNVVWAGGAGGGSGTDYAAAATATTSITNPNAWFEWVVSADVIAWLGTPASHLGWWITGDEAGTSHSKSFVSFQGTTAYVPQLVVTYDGSPIKIVSAENLQVEIAPPKIVTAEYAQVEITPPRNVTQLTAQVEISQPWYNKVSGMMAQVEVVVNQNLVSAVVAQVEVHAPWPGVPEQGPRMQMS